MPPSKHKGKSNDSVVTGSQLFGTGDPKTRGNASKGGPAPKIVDKFNSRPTGNSIGPNSPGKKSK